MGEDEIIIISYRDLMLFFLNTICYLCGLQIITYLYKTIQSKKETVSCGKTMIISIIISILMSMLSACAVEYINYIPKDFLKVVIISFIINVFIIITEEHSKEENSQMELEAQKETSKKFQKIIHGFVAFMVGLLFFCVFYDEHNTFWMPLLIGTLMVFISFALFQVIQILYNFSGEVIAKSNEFFDNICMPFLLFSHMFIIYYITDWFETNETMHRLFLLDFPFFIIILIFLIFLYRIGVDKVHVSQDYKTSKSGMIATMIFFIAIQLLLFTSIIAYITATDGGLCGLKWKLGDIKTSYLTVIDAFYYVVMTYTSVGYGDIHPVTPLMKLIACVISLCGFLSSVFFISTLCGMFSTKREYE